MALILDKAKQDKILESWEHDTGVNLENLDAGLLDAAQYWNSSIKVMLWSRHLWWSSGGGDQGSLWHDWQRQKWKPEPEGEYHNMTRQEQMQMIRFLKQETKKACKLIKDRFGVDEASMWSS